MRGLVLWGNYFDWVNLWLDKIEHTTVNNNNNQKTQKLFKNHLILFYEDLINDFNNQIIKITQFIYPNSNNLNDIKLQYIYQQTNFKTMSQQKQPWNVRFAKNFFRKGGMGDGRKNYLNKDQLKDINTMIKIKWGHRKLFMDKYFVNTDGLARDTSCIANCYAKL